MSDRDEDAMPSNSGDGSVKASASGSTCLTLTAMLLAASLGWAAGLDDYVVQIACNHGLGLSIAVLLAVSYIGYSTKTAPGKIIDRAAAAGATVLVFYGVVSGWAEIMATGKYGEAPFLVEPAPGMAINIAVWAFVLCLLRHGRVEQSVVERRFTLACLPIILSGLAFLLMVLFSWLVYEDARQTSEILAQLEEQMRKLSEFEQPPPPSVIAE